MKNIYIALMLLVSIVSYGDEYQKICTLVSSNDSAGLKPLLEDKKTVLLMDKNNRTLLFCAAKTGAYKSAKLLLDKGIDPHAKDKNDQTALEYLVEEELVSRYPGYRHKSHDFIKTGMMFLQYGANVNTLNAYGTPLLMRVYTPALVRLLVAYGADMNATDKHGRNALLHFAGSVGLSDKKRVKILKILLENGAELKSKDNEGKDFYQYLKHSSKYLFFKHTHYPETIDTKTVKDYLYKAIKDHDHATVEVLLKMGDFANEMSGYYRKPLVFDAVEDTRMLNLFFKYGLDVDSKSGNRTLLQEAIRKGGVDSVKLIIEHQPKKFDNFKTIATVMNLDDQNISMQIADFLFSKGVKISVADKQGHTLLHLAAKKSKDKLCQYFLDKGIAVDIRDKEGVTPVLYALTLGDNDTCAQILLKSGADIHQKIGNNVTLLHAAVKGRHLDIIKQLLDQGIDPNETDEEGHNALQLAAKNGDLESFKLLIKRGAKMKALDKSHTGVLHYACGWDKPIDMAKFLVEQGLDVNLKTKKGETALLIAVKNKNLPVALYLIDNKANLNAQDEKGNTALHYAVEEYSKKMMVLLLLKGADKNIKNKEGLSVVGLVEKKFTHDKKYSNILKGEYLSYVMDSKSIFDFKNLDDVILYAANGGNLEVVNDNKHSLLQVAVKRDKTDVVEYLVSLGLPLPLQQPTEEQDVNALDKDGSTPLMDCAVHNYHDKAKLLLKKGAKIDMQDARGRTALYITTVLKSYKTAQILLEHGANVNLETKKGDVPLMNAVRNSDIKMVDLLLKYKADTDVTDAQHNTALHIAVMNADEKTVKRLLDHKCDANKIDDLGLTALDYAKNLKLKTIVSLLDRVTKNAKKSDVPREKNNKIEEKLPQDEYKHTASKHVEKYKQSTLHQAVVSQKIDEVKALLQGSVKIDLVDKLGRTPLHYAAFGGNTEIIGLLLKKGANINAVDRSKQWTPLFFAVFMNHRDAVKLLIDNGADEMMKDKLNKTAYDYKKGK